VTAFDFVVFGVVVLSTLFGFARGFMRVVVSLAALVFAFMLAIHLSTPLGNMLPEFGGSPAARYVAAFAVIVIAVLIVGAIVGWLLYRLVRAIGLGFLDRWIQTPSNHRVHHAQNDIYLDRNYVGVFLIWDHLFGSFQEELEEEPCIYGIRGQLNSWNPVWANLHYYAAMGKDAWHAGSWRDKVRVWFAPPGWRPADVAARFPKRAYDPRVDFVKFDPARNAALSAYGLIQFVALVGANSQFLALLPSQATGLNVAYFLFILGSLVCVGGVLENRREFLIAEAARLMATGVVVLGTGAWFGGVRDARVVIAVAAFQAVSLGWLWAAAHAGAKSHAAVAAV